MQRIRTVDMGAKTVSLDPDAYEQLRRQKREGETFSDVVRRLSGRRRNILDYAGIWKGVPEQDLAKLRESFAEARRRDRERIERFFLSE